MEKFQAAEQACLADGIHINNLHTTTMHLDCQSSMISSVPMYEYTRQSYTA